MGVLSRVFSAAVPIGALTTAYLYRDDLAQDGLHGVTAPFRQAYASYTHPSLNEATNEFFDAHFPRGKWITNWDQRDPLSLVDEAKYAKATDEEKVKMMESVKAKATRNIILIRHGQYNMEAEPYALTALGREQAEVVGRRLSGLCEVEKFTAVTMSTMTRATETAQIILGLLPSSVPSRSDSILEEGCPYPNEPETGHWRPHNRKFFSEGARIEAAFRKYIHRAKPDQKKDSTEVIVCHANVIRYFVCRALQFPPEGWLRMSLANCSVTWIVIRPDGRVAIKAVGDHGHMPLDKVSFS